MIRVKALYYRYQHQLWYSLILIGVGMALLMWWQLSQSSASVSPKELSTITANQKVSEQKKTLQKTTDHSKEAQVVIDVKGEVHRPGVYYFAKKPIVADVISKAGGILPHVDGNRINFAATLTNGQVLFIPKGNEEPPTEYPLPGQPNLKTPEINKNNEVTEMAQDKVNLNTADVSTLQNLPGVGEKRAQDIITQRQKMGGFKTISDLKEVNGIGEKTFAKLKSLVTI